MTAPQGSRPRALSVIPVFGPCVACGIAALRVAVYADERHVHHDPSARKPHCVLPNPERGE